MDNSATNVIRLVLDGDQWCALLGEDLQKGIAGFGQTPALAVAELAQAIAQTPDDKLKRYLPDFK